MGDGVRYALRGERTTAITRRLLLEKGHHVRSVQNASVGVSCMSSVRSREILTGARAGTSHPTITSPEQGLEVLQRFVSQYRPPQAHEGFDQLLSLPVADQPADGVYSKADVENIVVRLQQSPRISPSQWRPYTAADRGRGGGGYQRGYYAPRGYTPRGRGGWGASQQSWRSGGY